MAEAALVLVIAKIGRAIAEETLNYAKPLLANRAGSVSALPQDMRGIRDGLQLIHAFLEETGSKGRTDDRVIDAWIGQARELAYDMEDTVDQFVYIVGKHHQGGSWWGYVKKIFKKPQSLFTLDEIATAVGEIKRRLNELKENRSWTEPLGVSSDNIPATIYDSQYVARQDYSIADDEFVGFDKNRETLIKSLQLDATCSRLRIIALWGMGGIGKSTIANNVYKQEASNFECHAWVSVSQSCKPEDVWRSMLKQIYAKDKKEFDCEKMNSEELEVELKKVLEGKRYLIILDDVWKVLDISNIKKVLVDNSRGSRIITTTRNQEVAATADDGCKIKVDSLSGDDAWRLFCRKAFPRNENHICPAELFAYGKEIVEKCDGLPLALVAIGSTLSLQVQSTAQWKRFCGQLNWELHNNENLTHVEKILNLSYKYLPKYLKSCFLFCSMFPEDYLMHRKKLIRLWIAEGFVTQKGQSSLEDVAEGYVIELVQRSMLHVVERNSFDRIKYMRMHDLVRELAVFQSKRESFSAPHDDNHGLAQVESGSRRVSVIRCKDNIQSIINPSRLRTFISFDTSMVPSLWTSFIPSESKYLAVLDLSGSPIESIPSSIGELFNLKYFCLDNTKVKELPKSVTKLHKLETLSLQRTYCVNLPRGSGKLKRLRHILIWKALDLTGRTFKMIEFIEPFEGVWNLKELQTLGIQASKLLVAKLGNLSQLSALSITNVTSSLCEQLCDSLSNMHQLSRFEIRTSNEDEVLQLQTLRLPCPLNKITLIGRLSEGTLESPFFSTHGNALRYIDLSCCELAENPLPRLSKLSNLTTLVVRRAYTGQNELNFNAQWFPNLKELFLTDLPHINQICIQKGALISLEWLQITHLVELRDAPAGLQYLKSLKRAVFQNVHPGFRSSYLGRAELQDIPIFLGLE